MVIRLRLLVSRGWFGSRIDTPVGMAPTRGNEVLAIDQKTVEGLVVGCVVLVDQALDFMHLVD